MVFRRKVYRRGRFRRQRRLNKRQMSQVKRMISLRQETKVFPIYFNATNVPTTPAIVHLTSISQGVGAQSRIGQEIRLVAMKARYEWRVADSTNTIRMIVFQWHGDSTDTPTSADILEDDTGGTGQPWLSPTKFFARNFTVLRDKLADIEVAANEVITGTWTIPLKKIRKRVTFGASNASGTNHIYILFLSDSTATTHPTLSVFGKLMFKDG